MGFSSVTWSPGGEATAAGDTTQGRGRSRKYFGFPFLLNSMEMPVNNMNDGRTPLYIEEYLFILEDKVAVSPRTLSVGE